MRFTAQKPTRLIVRAIPTLGLVELSQQQAKQVDALESLLTQPDPGAIRQGIELASALDDQEVFAALLEGMSGSKTSGPVAAHVRFATPRRATRFDVGTGDQALLDLGMIHLLAASDLPVRSRVRSIALGTNRRKFATPAPKLWLDGLERLTDLTHVDLHLTKLDEGIDLTFLERLPNLTHLRLRGATMPGPLGSMEALRSIDAVHLEFAAGAKFPRLQSIRGMFRCPDALTPDEMPNLVEVETRSDLRLAGFESLQALRMSRGHVELTGCERVEHLRANSGSLDAPDLRHVGFLEQVAVGFDVAQLESIETVKLNRTNRLNGAMFPAGAKLVDAKVVLWGPGLTDFGNIPELKGLKELMMPRVKSPLSLEPLRAATDLRVLDIRNSPGITDLSPLIELPNLEVLVLSDAHRRSVPPELIDRVQRFYRANRPRQNVAKATPEA